MFVCEATFEYPVQNIFFSKKKLNKNIILCSGHTSWNVWEVCTRTRKKKKTANQNTVYNKYFVLIWQSYSKGLRKGLQNCYIRLSLHVHGLPESTSVLDILWKFESTLYNTSDYFWSNNLQIIRLYVLTETTTVFYFQLQKQAPILHR